MIPGALYLRVSKDDGSQTTENQRPDVEQMAAGRGYTVAPAHVFVDEASGSKGADQRPALRRMLDAAARGEFRAVLVWRLDRLSRDDTFLGGLMMIGELDHFGVALLSHQETYLDTAGPFRRPLVQIAMTLAAEERRTLIVRTKAGIARARAAGVHVGRPRVEASAALLARAAAMRGEDEHPYGEGWRDIVRRLEREGFTNVPNHATLSRLCTKAYPNLRRGRPGWSQG